MSTIAPHETGSTRRLNRDLCLFCRATQQSLLRLLTTAAFTQFPDLDLRLLTA